MSEQKFWSLVVWSLRNLLTYRGKAKSMGRDECIQREVLHKTKESIEGFISTIPGSSGAYNTP